MHSLQAGNTQNYHTMLKKINFKRRVSRKTPPLVIMNAGSAQTAYQVLQRGVKRWEEEGKLLDRRELYLVQFHRTALVLSAAERQLLADSEQALNQQNNLLKGALVAVGIMLIAGAGLSLFWINSMREPLPVEQTIQAAERDEVEAIPVALPPGQEDPAAGSMAALGGFPIVEPAAIMGERSPAMAGFGSRPEPRSSRLGSFPIAEAPLAEPPPVEEEKAEVPAPEPVVEQKSRFSEIRPVQTNAGEVHIVQYNGRWALATPRERFLLLPEYDRIEVYDSRRGLFLIEQAGKEGMAAADGTVILYPFYERVKAYYAEEGFFVVANGGEYGVYDAGEGSFAVGLSYRDICCFSEGLFGVQVADGKWGFVDRAGQVIIAPAFDAIENAFENGRAVVRQGTEALTIDASGNAVVIR